MTKDDYSSRNVDIANSIEVNEKTLNNDSLLNFNTRKEKVEKVISDIVSNGKFTVNINLNNVNVEEERLERFVIELVPRLKEIGAKLTITNNHILSKEFLDEYKL